MWLNYVIYSSHFGPLLTGGISPPRSRLMMLHKAAGLPLLLDTISSSVNIPQSKLSLQNINYSVANPSKCRTQSMSGAFPLRQARRRSETSSASGKLCCSGDRGQTAILTSVSGKITSLSVTPSSDAADAPKSAAVTFEKET